MSELPTPTASRLRAPSWRDSRLIVGVLLVLLATVLGSVVVARADDRVPMYAAKGAIAPGRPLTADDVVRVEVRLGDGVATYLPADEPLPPDLWTIRELREGELIPEASIGPADRVEVQQVSLLVDATSAAALGAGSVVDVYVNRPSEGTSVGLPTYVGPEKTLGSVSVVQVSGDEGVLGGSAQTRAVRVMVPSDAVRDLVADVDIGARITLVPVPGTTTGSAA
ncbi:MAG: hypothetical protein WBL35_10570 [Ornithinibacter sp.]